MEDRERAEQLLVDAASQALETEGMPGEGDALQAMEEAARAGSADAEFLCGVLRLFGRRVQKVDPERALEHFQRAADAGSLDALYELGVQMEVRNAPRAEVIALYTRGARQRHLKCVNGLRAQYRESSTHRSEYFLWTAEAAALGDAEAQYHTGLMYATGDGVEPDLSRAIEWYRRSADAGFPHACHNLGVFHATGQGVEKDMRRAAEWYERAGDLGVSKSCQILAAMYYQGEGVQQDRALASEWLAKAKAAAQAERLSAARSRPRSHHDLEAERAETAREWLRTILAAREA